MSEGFEEAPHQSFPLLRRMIPRQLQPYLRGIRKRFGRSSSLKEPYYSVFPYTQAHPVRQENLVRLATDIDTRMIPGAVLECGVLDGGAAALMAWGTRQSGRPVYLFDSWDGLPDSTENDGTAGGKWSHQIIGSPKRVSVVMNLLKIDPNRLTFHKGWFSDTFPKANIQQIALLHIDADFYESVRDCFERWAPLMSSGGYIQIDDYAAFVGCRRAVDEFLAKRPDLELDTVGDYNKAYFIRFP